MPDLSIIVPVYNEEDSLAELHRQISMVEKDMNQAFEIIFVDDGSSDTSWNVVKKLATANNNVKCIRFRRNFGKAAALRAGAAETESPLVMTMDADLQDDPAEIPRFIEALGEDYDLISGWKEKRDDPLGKTLPSKVFNWMVGMMTGVKLHDHNCGFKLYRREIFDHVKLYGEMHRFVPVLATSKYGLERLPKGFLDLLTVSFLTGYNQRPQHIIGAMGLMSFFAGTLGVIYLSIYWLLRVSFEAFSDWAPLHERPLLLFSMGALLLGTQLLCMGFLAELIVKGNQDSNEPYTIRERVNLPD